MVTLLQSKDPRAKVLQGLTRRPPSLHHSSSSFRNMGGGNYPPLGLDESETRRSWVDESDPDTTGGHSGTSSIAIGHALAAANPHEKARFLALLTRGWILGSGLLPRTARSFTGTAVQLAIAYNPSHCETLRWKYFIHHH